MKAPSPLLGFNNNVRHKGRLFHIQTEDSGIRHPHIITHLFADGGRILKTTKTSYAEHVGQASLAETVRGMMKEQHKAMFIALRDGHFDYLFDDSAAPPVSAPAAAAPAAPEPSKAARPPAPSSPEGPSAPKPPPPSRPIASPVASPVVPPLAPEAAPRPKPAPAPTPPPRPAAPPARPAPAPAAAPPARAAAPEPAPASASARPRLELDPVGIQGLGSGGRAASPLTGRAVRPSPEIKKSEPSIDLDLDALERAAAEAQTPFFQQIQDLPPPPASVIGRRSESAASGAGVYSNVHPEHPSPPPAAPVAVEHFSGSPGSGRYAASRPASIFATNRPSEGASIFGDDLISEKSLDEVILSYLAEDLDSPPEKK
ncbi:hypothetical protein [Sorangium sp. So ce341]|uniref:hypothetical protein n=1 Tax=Sorangium sp. So ce341 TaxID=3133302 RepID=UPI003F5FA689